jgi:pimeloyl-ACP methyl ester carboxylesterase
MLKGFFVAAQPHEPTVLMLHGLASSKEEWLPLAKKLTEAGWGVLAYDARGHGESSQTRNASAQDIYKYLGAPGPGSRWERMIDDVGAAARFLSGSKKVSRSSIFLAGTSIGANVCLNFAALTRSVKGVVLLSPGLDYRSIRTEEAIQKTGKMPVLIVANSKDQYAYASSVQLASISKSATFWSDVKVGHGTQMLDDDLLNRLLQWFDKNK